MGQLPKTNTEIEDLSVEIQMKNSWQNATLQCLILCNYFKVSEVWARLGCYFFLSNVCSMNLSGMLRVSRYYHAKLDPNTQWNQWSSSFCFCSIIPLFNVQLHSISKIFSSLKSIIRNKINSLLIIIYRIINYEIIFDLTTRIIQLKLFT